MLTAAELANMRDAINQLMPDTCGIVSYTLTPDGIGGFTETASGTATVSCRLDKKDYDKVDASGKLTPFTEWYLSIPYDTTVNERNRITHGGYTYNILSANTDASWIAVKRLILERVP